MRIISGREKGRKLKNVKGKKTRPTQDRVKESIFNMIASFIPGAVGLDLFSGTGNLGLEALSRGAKHFVFVEKDYQSVETIKENIKKCDFQNRSIVYRGDAYKYLSICEEKFNLILMDPPYCENLTNKALDTIFKRLLLHKDGVIVIEHRVGEKVIDRSGYKIIKEKNYGDTGITILIGGI
ncbi:MAG TPA: 16S rRNA (guanine(966)-N(2))-methyltransferase RsmD [Halanaerobiales bacterium]|nr:16S rRNA (guanine(966)-N(2))-methyltransferase RsmD [Halanaerobiales bacterium]